jgi:hypothetical protein
MMYRIVVLLAVIAVATANLRDRKYYEEKFFNWLKEHKVVASSGEHFVKMLQNFANNDDLIETHNAKNLSYQLGHNKFSHMSVEEWREHVRLGLKKPEIKAEFVHMPPGNVAALPDSVDWVNAGAVTGVSNHSYYHT